jgi:ABC-type uncharacterized transport system substrate-binding protein
VLADQTSRRAYSIPAICPFRDFAYEGGLMAYFAEEDEMYRSAAVLVDKILNGAKPAESPVEQPTKFALLINVKTAKELDIRATEPAGDRRRGDRIRQPRRFSSAVSGCR